MTVVAIPSIENIDGLAALVTTLVDDDAVDRVYVLDNGHPPENLGRLPRSGKVMRLPCAGLGLYRMWNLAIEMARDHEYVMLANDDIVLAPGSVTELVNAMNYRPDVWLMSPDRDRPLEVGIDDLAKVRYTRGTYRHGGVSGWCMLLRTAPVRGLEPIDENFGWWYGDDDLAFKVEDGGGKLAVHTGVPLVHEHETTARNHEWTFAARERDHVYAKEKWGNR